MEDHTEQEGLQSSPKRSSSALALDNENGSYLFKCWECNLQSVDLTQIIMHRLEVHLQVTDEFACMKCSTKHSILNNALEVYKNHRVFPKLNDPV